MAVIESGQDLKIYISLKTGSIEFVEIEKYCTPERVIKEPVEIPIAKAFEPLLKPVETEKSKWDIPRILEGLAYRPKDYTLICIPEESRIIGIWLQKKITFFHMHMISLSNNAELKKQNSSDLEFYLRPVSYDSGMKSA